MPVVTRLQQQQQQQSPSSSGQTMKIADCGGGGLDAGIAKIIERLDQCRMVSFAKDTSLITINAKGKDGKTLKDVFLECLKQTEGFAAADSKAAFSVYAPGGVTNRLKVVTELVVNGSGGGMSFEELKCVLTGSEQEMRNIANEVRFRSLEARSKSVDEKLDKILLALAPVASATAPVASSVSVGSSPTASAALSRVRMPLSPASSSRAATEAIKGVVDHATGAAEIVEASSKSVLMRGNKTSLVACD